MLMNIILLYFNMIIVSCSEAYLNSTKLFEPLTTPADDSEQTIHGPIQSVRSLAVLKDDQLVSGSYKTIQIWNITNGNLIQTLNGSIGLVHSIIILNDGHLVSCSADLEYKPWHVQKQHKEDGWIGDINIRDVNNFNINSKINKSFVRVRSLAVFDNKTFISHYFDPYGFSYVGIYKTNGELQKEFYTSRIGDLIECIVVLADKTIAIGKSNDEIQLWNGNYESWRWFYGGYIRTLKGHNGPVRSLVVLNDGFRLASGSLDCKIKIWNTKNGKLLRTIEESAFVYSLVVLNDGSLASGCADSKIKIWNPNNGLLIRILNGHKAAVRSLVLLNDRRLASGSDDAKIKIWQIETKFDMGVDTSLATANSSAMINGCCFNKLILFHITVYTLSLHLLIL